MKAWLSIVAAFFRRDWRIHRSYRFQALPSIAHAVLQLAPFFFLGRLVDSAHAKGMEAYGGSYFAFVLLGVASTRYVGASLSGFAGRLRSEQSEGTLEAVALSPAPRSAFLLGTLAWELLWATVELVVFLAVGVVLFSADLRGANLYAAGLALVLGISSLGGIGVLSACSVLIWKEADPAGWALGGLMRIASGVFFPLAILPAWMQPVAHALPLTPMLEAIRQAVLLGRGPSQLLPQLIGLGVFSLVVWPVAFFCFEATLVRLRRDGTLNFR